MAGVALGTPLADALSSVVHTKITDIGWNQEDDTSLAEYIVLMLVNGKTQDQIVSELASDLLPDAEGTEEFAQWLFDQVAILQHGGGVIATAHAPSEQDNSAQSIPSFQDQETIPNSQGHSVSADVPAAYDTDMGDFGGAAPDNAPKGPKGMHGGRPAGRGGRMMGQLHKAMDRSTDSALHRVRPQSGTERINSHSRGPPKGPRNNQSRDVRPGMQKAINGAGMPGFGPPLGPGLPNPLMQNGGPGVQGIVPMSTQQQMEFMAMMEQQARMMAQFLPGMGPPAINPAFQQNGVQTQSQAGRSLFDRVEAGPGRGQGRNRGRGRGSQQNTGTREGASSNGGARTDTDMETEHKTDNAPSSSMEVEQSSQNNSSDPFSTLCRYNLRCTNKSCPYAHQSPAAPEGTTVDMSDTCSFGAACKNHKCVGRHPSPSQVKAHQSEEQCRFFPYCTNPSCPFKHPSMPMCRNGADCTVPHCKFTHLQTPCKFNPCMNARCPFKHAEGQKGSYADKVWTADGAEKKDEEHVSERKFVLEDGEEELIKPETVTEAVQGEQLIT